MAKKKNEPIVIKDEPLMPTTIGTYVNKKKGGLAVFFVLASFIAIVFFLPNIIAYINGEDNPNSANVPVQTDPNPEPDQGSEKPSMGDELEKYAISEDTIINMESYTVSNISNINNELKVTFNGVKSANLSNMYFEVFNEENSLLGRILIGDIDLSSGSQVERTYKSFEGASKIAITKKTIDDYPAVTLNYDEFEVGTLVCSQNASEKYEYNFKEDKLISFSYDHTESYLDNPSYVENINKYQGMVNTYNGNQGIVASLNTSDTGFTYVLIVDLLSADYSKLINLKSYKKDTLVKEISFKNTASGFNCYSK